MLSDLDGYFLKESNSSKAAGHSIDVIDGVAIGSSSMHHGIKSMVIS
jgi:hypothetical protein